MLFSTGYRRKVTNHKKLHVGVTWLNRTITALHVRTARVENDKTVKRYTENEKLGIGCSLDFNFQLNCGASEIEKALLVNSHSFSLCRR